MNVETEKISIALEYIETASILWIHDINYYSVMHLAAAAEEISGKACRIERKKSNYDELREKVIRMLSAVRVDHTENDIKNAFYGAKNSIKHLDNESDRLVNLNSKNESATYCIDPAVSAQARLLKHKPRQGFAYQEPGGAVDCYKSQSSHQ